jgi:hypothetical protein
LVPLLRAWRAHRSGAGRRCSVTGASAPGRRRVVTAIAAAAASGIIGTMATYAVSQEELAREQRLLNDPRWQAEREPLRDLLMRVADASSDQDFFEVHVSLLSRLKARQQFIDELRSQADELGRRRRELANKTPKPISELRRVQAELDEVLWSMRVQRSLRWLLLDVGDALVWRRLGFDRAAITALGSGQRVAWLSGGRGWDAEVGAIDQLWSEGTLALLNDATTCLRLGDLTCFFNDRVEIREVKAGKVVGDEDPQQIRLREAITLINERRGVVDGNRRAIVRCPEPLETHLRELPKLLANARKSGRSVMSASRAQLVVAHDLGAGVPDRFDEADARANAGWPSRDLVMDWGTSLRRMRDRHYNFAYLAPMSLLPIGIDEKIDLLLGQLDFSVWINVSSVAATLRGRGLIAEPIEPPESTRWFLRAGRRRGNSMTVVHVAAHLREMMAIELVTPVYVTKLVQTLLDSVESDPQLFDEQTIVVPGDESIGWRPNSTGVP